VLSFDYLGALLATLAFPFVLLPVLGTFRASLVLGLVNMTVGFLNLVWFAARMRLGRRALWTASLAVTALLAALLAVAEPLLDQWSDRVYDDRVIYREQTRYQQVVLTRYRDDVRLFLNGNLQFSSLDEQRYHEPLIHVPLGLMPARSAAARPAASSSETAPSEAAEGLRVLVLGGGDGLAARELLKHAHVAHVTVVDLDPAVFALARTHPALTRLNARSLHSPRVTTVAQDALVFLEDGSLEDGPPEEGSPEDASPEGAAVARYDVIVADLPDPNNVSLARLYSRGFYRLVRRRLAPGGVFVTQATSPYFAREAFWCIAATVEAAGFAVVHPYHASVPSFGEWGFVLAADRPLDPAAARLPVATRFLTPAVVPGLFAFPADLARPTPAPAPSTLDRPRVLDLYLDGWRYWN
jgi:spermidine synthase